MGLDLALDRKLCKALGNEIMRGDRYQLSLIFLGLVVTALFGAFLYREIFPEYKVYQNAYLELENFRSSYTGQPPPPFDSRIKQIVLEQADKGPATIDRCTSCHVALQFSHFSPTKIATDINGKTIYDESGLPTQVKNPNYIWDKLDQKIADLQSEGKKNEADKLAALKTAEVGEHVYDMTKVLRAHPIIGRESRPFETHAIDEYGCTVCHNGNGRGLTTPKAHGPVFDGQYEAEHHGPAPEFTEKDPLNDPAFSRIFNHKPGHGLLFQTSPIYVGALLQSKCVQCHTSSSAALQGAAKEAEVVTKRRAAKSEAVKLGFKNEKASLISLLELKESLKNTGIEKTKKALEQTSVDYIQSQKRRMAAKTQLAFLQKQESENKALEQIDSRITEILGNQKLIAGVSVENLDIFIEKNRKDENATGSLFKKLNALDQDAVLMAYIQNADTTIEETTSNELVQGALASEIDLLTQNYHRGEKLFLSQACYSCHRIDGLTRGGVGPDLTNSGNSYPWFLKESMVWPQADLKTSTMPNFHLDHEELEDLTTFLLAQHGRSQAVSESSYKTQLLNWEAGYKQPWERPINPGKLYDLRNSMTIFATEGCASCHRLKGYQSDVGFAIEKGKKPSFDALYQEKEWFKNLVPEGIIGSDLVAVLEAHVNEIDERIVDGVRSGSILEELDAKHPKTVESFNTDFKYARRAKNHTFAELLANAKTPVEREIIEKEQAQWKKRVRRVMMMYVQEYGLGRLVGPKPNWSGIYRSDEWLIEHFRKPSRHIAKSIMPVLPFDDSKFYALTYMLNALGKQNRDEIRKVWNTYGFDSEHAYQHLCSQCHGEYLHGNGPVSEWIYPIPKNLRNANFLRHFTRENAISSIVHGVKGTPMPPWGEVAEGKKSEGELPVLTQNETNQLVDWIFTSLLGGSVIRSDQDVEKWKYDAEDVLDELEREKNQLDPGPPPEFIDLDDKELNLSRLHLPSADHLLVSTEPVFSIEENAALGKVGEVFNVLPNPFVGGGKYAYYIKQRYYTEENLRKGQEFFELNCSVCHGREADGQGLRAGTMFDAKPRMLTNFHWIDTRDDLRLIRSIKYGIPGTSMTPWGDQTSSLQRLQLVMYIRSLSKEQKQRDDLFNVIYSVFDEADQVIDRARVKQYTVINALKSQLNEIRSKDVELLGKIEQGKAPSDAALALYRKELDLNRSIKENQAADQLLVDIKDLVKQESLIYQNLGVQLIGKPLGGDIFENYLNLVKADNIKFKLDDGLLQLEQHMEKEEVVEKAAWDLFQELQERIRMSEIERGIVEGKLPSNDRTERLEELNENIRSYRNLQSSLISGMEEAKRLREKQQKLYAEYENKLKTLKTQKI